MLHMNPKEEEHLKKAIEDLTKELPGKDDSTVAKILLQRAEMYAKLGQRDEATVDIRTAVQRSRGNRDIVKNAESLIQKIYDDIKENQTMPTSKQDVPKDTPKLRRYKEIIKSVSNTDNAISNIKTLIVSKDFVDILQSCGDPDEATNVKTAAIIIVTSILNSESMSEKQENGTPLLVQVTNIASSCFKQCFDSGRAADKVNAFSTLTVLFQANLSVGVEIFNQQGLLEDIMDTIEFEKIEVQVAFANTLAQACSDSNCRKHISKHCSNWLATTASSRSQKNSKLQISASVALTKLSNANDKGTDSIGLDSSATNSEVDQLANAMKEHSISREQLSEMFKDVIKDEKTDSSQLLVAVEGLAYNSMQATVKDSLVNDVEFLKRLFKLAQTKDGLSAMLFGIGTILANMTGYLPVLSEQQKQMKKLRDLANAKGAAKGGKKPSEEHEDPRDQDAAVEERIEQVVKHSVVPALIELSKSHSSNVQAVTVQTFLNIVTPHKLRGTIVQQGGAKCLLRLVGAHQTEKQDYIKVASQALAKIAITMDPRIAFPGEAAHSLVKPLLQLCQDEKPLRNFEGLMALTNLASVDENIRARIYVEQGLPVIEGLQFSDNVMIRRAATELLCNMMFAGPVFEAYSDPNQPGAQAKIKLLLALSDVEDFETRRAASGALAILANSSGSCSMIVKENGYQRISQLLEKDEKVEVQHRGVEIVRCLLEHETKEAATVMAQLGVHLKLVDIVKLCTVQPVRAAAMEVLKLFSQNGITNFNG
ncbi:armadillo-type protein [Umbelopsis sp. PMI_123]|nr:armadillo-type protein [Umbelopsis sp. PMI_123]